MADVWDELALLQGEQTTSPMEVSTPTTPSIQPSYSFGQGVYDIGTGALKAGLGLADLITTPGVALARAGGLNVPYFGISKMAAEDLAAIAPQLGLAEGSTPQQIAEFVTPLPGKGKVDMLKQAGLGLASYLGMKGAENIAPESSATQLAAALTAPTAVVAASRGLQKIAPSLTTLGESLQRTSLGFRQSDFTKVSKNQIIETLPGEFTTQAQKSADNIIKNEALGNTTNPTELYSNLQNAKETAETAIQSVLQKVDETRQTGIIPRLDETLQWIKTKAPADKVDFYKDKVNTFLKALKEQGQGSLVYLNQQKKAIGENWKSSPETDPSFWRKFYKDIKTNIEIHAPEVKDLNKTKQDLIVVEPVIERGFRAAAQSMTPQDWRKALLYTTGGGGLVGATVLGGGLVPGALLSGALALAGTKRGQKILGKTLAGVEGIAPSGTTDFNRFATLIGKTLQANQLPTTAVEEIPAQEISQSSVWDELSALEQSPQLPQESDTIQTNKQNISIPTGEQYAPPSLVKAVINVESAGKPDAVSSKGATGLMQLMPKTAKSLGVDPTDPVANVEGGSRYLQQLISKYGSQDIALAAYNWGPGNIDKAISKLKARDKAITWENIRKLSNVPLETRMYVNKVLKA
jgi:hypothetical protein